MKNWQKKLIKISTPYLKKLEPDHGIGHSERVFKNCLMFAKDYPKIDKDVLFAAAYLHDLGHLKLKNGMGDHNHLSLEFTNSILKETGIPEQKFSLIRKTILKHDSREVLRKKMPEEIFIFSDADSIDGVGALGLARQFVFSGRVGKKLWDQNIERNPPLPYGGNFSSLHTILDVQLKLKFYTRKGKKMAQERKEYMIFFVENFLKEWCFEKDSQKEKTFFPSFSFFERQRKEPRLIG